MINKTLKCKIDRFQNLLNEEYGKIINFYPVVVTDDGITIENNFPISGVTVEVLFNFRGIKGFIWHGINGSSCVLSEYNSRTKEWFDYDFFFSNVELQKPTLFRLEKLKKTITITKVSIKYQY